MARPSLFVRPLEQGEMEFLAHLRKSRRQALPQRAQILLASMVYTFGGYDVHADVLFGGYRLAKTTNEVFAFYKYIRRRYPDHVRIHLVNDNLSLHWTPQIRAWAESHNVELVPTPTSASHLNRIECHFRPLRPAPLQS